MANIPPGMKRGDLGKRQAAPEKEEEEGMTTTSKSFHRIDGHLRMLSANPSTINKVKVHLTANKMSYQQLSFSCLKSGELGYWKSRVLQLELGLGVLRSVKKGAVKNEFPLADIKRMTKQDGNKFVLCIDFVHYYPYKVAFFNRVERGLFFNLIRLFNVQGYIADKKLPYDPPPWMPNEIQQEISLSKQSDREDGTMEKVQSGFMTILYPYVHQGTLKLYRPFKFPMWAPRKVCVCHEKIYVYISDGIEAKSPEQLIPLEDHEVTLIGVDRIQVKVGGRIYKFEAENEDSRNKWVRAFTQNTNTSIYEEEEGGKTAEVEHPT